MRSWMRFVRQVVQNEVPFVGCDENKTTLVVFKPAQLDLSYVFIKCNMTAMLTVWQPFVETGLKGLYFYQMPDTDWR